MELKIGERSAGRFFMDWAAVVALVVSVAVFGALRGGDFLSAANAVNILRAMSITTIFAIAATIAMAPDGFDMSACTLATFSSYIFASSFLWFGAPLWLSALITVVFTMAMYLINMFLILVCKIPDMLATCALMFVHQGLGLWWSGGGAISSGMPTRWGSAPVRSGWTDGFLEIGRSPWCIIIMLACAAFAFVLLNYTRYGRCLYAIGGNRTAAELSGQKIQIRGRNDNRGSDRRGRDGRLLAKLRGSDIGLRQLFNAVSRGGVRGQVGRRRGKTQRYRNYGRRGSGGRTGKRSDSGRGRLLRSAGYEGRCARARADSRVCERPWRIFEKSEQAER